MSRTNKINIRTLNPRAKKRIRKLLQHGDMVKIADRCTFATYRHVADVIRGRFENDKVWKVAIEFLNEQTTVEVDGRLAKIIEDETEAA